MAVKYNVRVFECDQCGHKWLPEKEQFPTNCPSRKCRSRKWNEDGVAEDLVPVDSVPVNLPPGTAAERIAALIPGVRLGVNGPQLSVADPVEAAEPERRMCKYKEYVGDIGEWMRCGLFEHGPKTKHGNWQQV